MLKHVTIIATAAVALIVGVLAGLRLYGSPIGLGIADFGLHVAAFGGETIHTTAPGCDEAALLAAVSEVVGDAMARPVVVTRAGGK